MATLKLDDTICAISTPLGIGGIGIVRLSGPEAIKIVSSVFRFYSSHSLTEAKSHTITFGHIYDEEKVLDEVLVAIYRKPKSYTKEDLVEINTHGGSLVARRVLELMIKKGARLAEPGEFTKRAFLNGRIDLTQAEAVLDLIKAKTELARDTAMQQLTGSISQKIKKIKERLLHLYAQIEAYVDFPEEDIEIFSQEKFLMEFEEISDQLRKLVDSYSQGEIIREGILTVIIGKPNVGKSSLLNALLDRDRAIVSELPGTTRDVLEELINIQGLLVRLADTAGLRTGGDKLEKMSVEKTKTYLQKGDLFLFMLDGSTEFGQEDEEILEEIKNKNFIILINKIDLEQKMDLDRVRAVSGKNKFCFISCLSKEGFNDLENAILSMVWQGKIDPQEISITRLRQKKTLEKAIFSLGKAKEAFLRKESLEFLVFDLRETLNYLAELIGEVYTEDILDIIFQEFCIGK